MCSRSGWRWCFLRQRRTLQSPDLHGDDTQGSLGSVADRLFIAGESFTRAVDRRGLWPSAGCQAGPRISQEGDAMNDETHLEILKKRGIAGWNLWRRQNPNLIPNLRRGSLSDLFGDDSTITIRSKPIKKGQRLKKGHRLDLAGVNLSHAEIGRAHV